MWPFSTKLNEADQLALELPDNIKDFYDRADPTKAVDLKKAKDEKVASVVAKNSSGYSHELAKHKREFRDTNAAAINCAELQQAVLDCHKQWLMFSVGNCSEPIKKASECQEIQIHAFNKLRYNDCYSEKHCSQMRFLVDRLFTTTFGQLGEDISEENQAKFDKSVDSVFDKVWR